MNKLKTKASKQLMNRPRADNKNHEAIMKVNRGILESFAIEIQNQRSFVNMIAELNSVINSTHVFTKTEQRNEGCLA